MSKNLYQSSARADNLISIFVNSKYLFYRALNMNTLLIENPFDGITIVNLVMLYNFLYLVAK